MSIQRFQHLFLLRVVASFWAAISVGANLYGNDRPVIGILTQELTFQLRKYYDYRINSSYIAASYVKYFESSGARLTPIATNRSMEYYRTLVSHVNGVVFPGGCLQVAESEDYGRSGRLLLSALEESAAAGNPIPALGIGLGMQLMAWHDYKKMLEEFGELRRLMEIGPLYKCKIHLNLPIKLKMDPKISGIFRKVTESSIDDLIKRPITVNELCWCLSEDSMEQSGIRRLWNVVATSRNRYGHEFVAVMQARDRPFYGIMFHPNKNAFEWKDSKRFVRDVGAIKSLRGFADSFVEMCRENNHVFPEGWERLGLIHRFDPVYLRRPDIDFEQIYLFKNRELSIV